MSREREAELELTIVGLSARVTGIMQRYPLPLRTVQLLKLELALARRLVPHLHLAISEDGDPLDCPVLFWEGGQ